MKSEATIQQEIRLAIGAKFPLWRNECGQVNYRDKQGQQRFVRYGLCKGSADLIGIRPVLITPEMVGTTIGQFVGREVKTERGRPSELQVMFLDLINRNGGIGAIVKSAEEAEEVLR